MSKITIELTEYIKLLNDKIELDILHESGMEIMNLEVNDPQLWTIEDFKDDLRVVGSSLKSKV